MTLSSICVFAAVTNAQPVLTFASNAPVAGTSYTMHYSAYVSPGQAGAGQSWNLSTLGTDSIDVIQLVQPGATENGSSFPGSTVAETGAAASMYWRAAADGMYFVGSDASDLLIVNKTDLERLVLGLDADLASNALEVHVSALRRKLGRDLIDTVRGLGYRIGQRS